MKSFIMERLILTSFNSLSMDLRLDDFTNSEFTLSTLMEFLSHLLIKKFMLADYQETLTGLLLLALPRLQYLSNGILQEIMVVVRSLTMKFIVLILGKKLILLVFILETILRIENSL